MKYFELVLWLTFAACCGALALLLIVSYSFYENAEPGLRYTVIGLMWVISMLSFCEFNKNWNKYFNKGDEE